MQATELDIDAQLDTLHMLFSVYENLSVSRDEYIDNGTLVFSAEGEDGPTVGYIEIDGTVSWLAQS